MYHGHQGICKNVEKKRRQRDGRSGNEEEAYKYWVVKKYGKNSVDLEKLINGCMGKSKMGRHVTLLYQPGKETKEMKEIVKRNISEVKVNKE